MTGRPWAPHARVKEKQTVHVCKHCLQPAHMAESTRHPLDAKGKPAAVDGAPTWASSDETQVTLEVASDVRNSMNATKRRKARSAKVVG